jgi:O-antigen/teichoic acid export membrane protein
LLTLAIRFFLTPFILHRLGDAQFGLWALATSVVGQGELLDFGIRAALTKYVAEHYSQGNYEHTRHLIATSLWLYSGLGLLALLLSALLAPAFPHLFNVASSSRSMAETVVLLMGIQIAVALPGAAPAAVLWGLHKYTLVNSLIMISTALSAAITVAVLLAGGGLIAMIAANVPLAVGMLFLGMYILKRVAPELYPSWRDARRRLLRSVLSFSSSTFVIETAFNLQTRADEAIIGAIMPITAVTPYTIARRLSTLPQIVAQQTVAGLLPVSSQLQAESRMDRLQSLYLVSSRVSIAMCMPLTVILVFLAGPLLTIWVGPTYAQYAPIVVILAIAGLAEISHWPGGLILQGIARHRYLAAAYVCAALANLALSVLLIGPYGLMGVALGTLVPSIALSLCFVWPYVSTVLGVPWRDQFTEVLMPAFWPLLPMIVVLYAVGWIAAPQGLVLTGVNAAAGIATYLAAYLLWGAGEPEKQLIRSARTSLSSIRLFSSRLS